MRAGPTGEPGIRPPAGAVVPPAPAGPAARSRDPAVRPPPGAPAVLHGHRSAAWSARDG